MNDKAFDIMTFTISMIVVTGIIVGGLWLSTLFIDYEAQLEGSTNTTGSIDIDTDVFDDIQDEMEDFADDSFDGFDFGEMNNVLITPITLLIMVGIVGAVVVYFTKK